MKMMAAMLALAVCASAHASESNEKDVRVEKTFNGIKHTADRNGLSVTRVGFSTEDVGQGPYTQARVTVFENTDGEQKILASKIVALNQSDARYSDSVDYIGECTKMENTKPKCTTASTPVGVMAHVQYMGTPKNSDPLYRVALGWRVLEKLPTFQSQEEGLVVDLPNIASREFLQNISYKQPVEFGVGDVKDTKKTTVLRLELL